MGVFARVHHPFLKPSLRTPSETSVGLVALEWAEVFVWLFTKGMLLKQVGLAAAFGDNPVECASGLQDPVLRGLVIVMVGFLVPKVIKEMLLIGWKLHPSPKKKIEYRACIGGLLLVSTFCFIAVGMFLASTEDSTGNFVASCVAVGLLGRYFLKWLLTCTLLTAVVMNYGEKELEKREKLEKEAPQTPELEESALTKEPSHRKEDARAPAEDAEFLPVSPSVGACQEISGPAEEPRT